MSKKKIGKKVAPPKKRGKKVWRGPSQRALDKLAAGRKRVAQPRQPRLPGQEDAHIQQLEDIGASYAEIRDQRIALNEEEHSLKQTALALMHKYGKTIYRTAQLEILVSPGDEQLKVKLKKVKEPVVNADAPDNDGEFRVHLPSDNDEVPDDNDEGDE